MSIKASVNPNRCEAWGYCAKLAPEVFVANPSGSVILETVPEELRAKAILAMNDCPTAAITVADE